MSSFTSSIQICDLTDIRWVAVKKGPIVSEIHGFSIATPRILVESHICKCEVEQVVKLHTLCTDHVTIQSELKYLIGAKVMRLKCRVYGGKTGLIAMVQILCGKNCCNGSVLVPTITLNCSSWLERLLTLSLALAYGGAVHWSWLWHVKLSSFDSLAT